ncbi:MAG: flippase-like domain-containing protein [Rhizobacter sp.]|nr:flippase-like domain-containing protein [Bacteriovorax sp.]
MSEKNKKIYHAILLVLSLALFAGLIFYVQKNSNSFTQLKSVKLPFVVLLILIHALYFWLLGMTHKLPLKKHNILLTFKEWYGLCMVSELFNMLLPANGGTGIRMLYIKDKKKLPMREFLAMSFAIVLIGFTFLGIMGIIYCEFFLKKNDTIFVLLESVFIALAISGSILIFATETIAKFFKFKRKHSPKFYLKDYKLTALATLCWIGMFILFPLKIYLSFLAIGIDLSFAQSFEISLILMVASLFQVLPGNIGVKEIITAYVAKQYGIPFETALLASLIDRTILLVFLFPVGFYFYWQLFLEVSIPQLNLPNLVSNLSMPFKKRINKSI